MHMRHSLPLIALLTLAACKQPAPPPAESGAPAAAAAASAMSPEVVAIDDHASPADAVPGFDIKAVAGAWRGTLPCASCPGIDTTLELQADGRYRLVEVYREEADSRFDTGGSWAAEAGGQRIRLDPDDKDERDRVYALANGTLLQLGEGDQPPPDAAAYTLRRSP